MCGGPREIMGYYAGNNVKLSVLLDDANTVNMLIALIQSQVLSRQTARDVAHRRCTIWFLSPHR